MVCSIRRQPSLPGRIRKITNVKGADKRLPAVLLRLSVFEIFRPYGSVLWPEFCESERRMISRSLFGKGVLLVFILTQVADGLFTYFGIKTFGADIEGNPLVAWYVSAFGAGVAIVGAKALALACGAALHLRAMHRTIGALTLIYLTAAVWPWFQIFTGAIAP